MKDIQYNFLQNRNVVDTDFTEFTPLRSYSLHWAAYNGKLDVCKQLISSGINTINDLTSINTTPLMYAVLGNHFDVVEYFLKIGADPNLRFPSYLLSGIETRNGQTALHHSVYIRSLNLCQLLISNKADLQAIDGDDKTPLDIALENYNIGMVKCLWESEKHLCVNELRFRKWFQHNIPVNIQSDSTDMLLALIPILRPCLPVDCPESFISALIDLLKKAEKIQGDCLSCITSNKPSKRDLKAYIFNSLKKEPRERKNRAMIKKQIKFARRLFFSEQQEHECPYTCLRI
ncbi:hypothetical protein QYM36_005141 [Artemia franciscana]|uniref:Uncharacterized protein n=1 Tax=Artemia franciscana TaxID=6661 RepID=A0AA88LFA6_ARTSF|nr:hypothetical protein QYM36_005041 [Artemia franciscana]KAK2719568.1 hypothetical protein QYM36_005141 [Artemia franciscana]